MTDGSWVWVEPQSDMIYTGSLEAYLENFMEVSWVEVVDVVIVW